MPAPTNGWNEYKKLILHELDQHNTKLDKVIDSIADMRSEISALKVKAAIAGGAAGVVGTALVTAALKLF